MKTRNAISGEPSMTKEAIEAGIAALESSISTVETWVLIFAALVAIGVVGEAVLGVRHWILDGRLHALRADQSALHEKQLADADKKVAELQQQQAPRRLTNAQKQTLIAALAPHKGQKITLLTILGDGEAKRFLEDFIAVLDAAGWDHNGDAGILYGNFGGTNDPIGVIVLLNAATAAQKRGPLAVLPLTQALAGIGLVKANDVTPSNDVKPGDIGLVIGRKPRAGDVEKWPGVPLSP